MAGYPLPKASRWPRDGGGILSRHLDYAAFRFQRGVKVCVPFLALPFYLPPPPVPCGAWFGIPKSNPARLGRARSGDQRGGTPAQPAPSRAGLRGARRAAGDPARCPGCDRRVTEQCSALEGT